MLNPDLQVLAAPPAEMFSIGDGVADFFAGMFLVNCVPHLVASLQGMPFPTPFAKPPGEGDSAPTVNFAWGAFNLLVGVLLLVWKPVVVGWTGSAAASFVGFLIMGFMLALHFGKVRRHRFLK